MNTPNPSEAREIAYDAIDRFLRNNLGDDDYATYLDYLETVWQQDRPTSTPPDAGDRTGDSRNTPGIEDTAKLVSEIDEVLADCFRYGIAKRGRAAGMLRIARDWIEQHAIKENKD